MRTRRRVLVANGVVLAAFAVLELIDLVASAVSKHGFGAMTSFLTMIVAIVGVVLCVEYRRRLIAASILPAPAAPAAVMQQQ